MTPARTPRTHPGPWWLWVTAWSLQGAGLLAVKLVELEVWWLEFLVAGGIAAVPLVGLYLYLLRSSPED